MATLIPYRQRDPEAVTIGKAGPTDANARARTELAAMKGVADLLAGLPDAAARDRVLLWVDAMFRQSVSASVQKPTATPVQPNRAAVREPVAGASQECDLSVGDFEDWFSEPSASPLDDDRLPEPDPTQPVVSMIHGFVEDFQKLARDWREDKAPDNPATSR